MTAQAVLQPRSVIEQPGRLLALSVAFLHALPLASATSLPSVAMKAQPQHRPSCLEIEENADVRRFPRIASSLMLRELEG